MNKTLLFTIILFSSFYASGQYRFGLRLGTNYTTHRYQETSYKRDSFNIDNNFGFQGGLAVNYTASELYSVYGEILYERIGRELRDQFTDGNQTFSTSTNSFLTVPLMLRVTLGRVPFHYYCNFGPRLSYWLGGNGEIILNSFEEFRTDVETGEIIPFEYEFTFREEEQSSSVGLGINKVYNEFSQRLQFGLTAGAGIEFDLLGGGQMMIDFRYAWVHSNMATANTGILANIEGYVDNLEYSHNIGTITIGYFIEYNSSLRRKGKTSSGIK